MRVKLFLLQAPALLVFSYCTHTLKVSSAQSTLTPDTVLTAAVVIGGALLDPHARLPAPSPNLKHLRRGWENTKPKSAAGAAGAAPESPAPSPKNSKAKATAAESVSVSAAAPILTVSSSLPGAFDGAPGTDSPRRRW
ncbi:hypothetical protein B0H14DRAFT_3889160 [Mycena olivaceomarginata]|nr:hypothetical protein B0H14DRAFT_3889160 [Mycena olivaceomarginata]